MNAFEDFGNRTSRRPRRSTSSRCRGNDTKPRQPAHELRDGSGVRTANSPRDALKQKHVDDSHLIKEWREWRHEEVKQALAGRHGEALRLMIERLKAARRWNDIDAAALEDAWAGYDYETRIIVRGIVSAFISTMRVRAGLPPFDDPLPF